MTWHSLTKNETPFFLNREFDILIFFPDSFGQPRIDHYYQQKRYWLRCQIYRCWSRYRRSGRIWSWNRICVRFPYHWLCSQPFPQSPIVFIRYFGIRFVWSYGSFLSYDGLHVAIRLLKNYIWAHFWVKKKYGPYFSCSEVKDDRETLISFLNQNTDISCVKKNRNCRTTVPHLLWRKI